MVAVTQRADQQPQRAFGPAGPYCPELMPPPSTPAAMDAIRAGLNDLLNDPALSDRTRLSQLEALSEEIAGLILDLRSRLPVPRARRSDPPRI
jgi:hypothetical protein